MKSARAWIATAFVLASGVAPAMAADWGGVKDMGGGVPIPVPAPAPVPTYDADSDWYIGLVLGGNLLTDADIKDVDIDNLGASSAAPLARSDGGPAQVTYGLVFGRYFTPSLRWEVAVDYMPDTQISRDGVALYTATNSAFNTVPGVGTDINSYDVARTETVKLSRTTALFNVLYDIPTGTRFTPYIGGGLGLTWRRMTRSYGESWNCTGATNTVSGDYPANTCSGNPSLSNGSGSVSGSTSKNQIDLAAAVQAGVATELTDSIIWDNGWQMLWEAGSISTSGSSVAGINKFTFKDSVLQQFRSGIRIKFD